MEKEISTDNLIEKINTYCDIVTEFSKLLETENEALRVYDVEKIAQLYDQKTHIVGAYRSIVAFFIKNQTLLSSIELSYREKLKTLAAGLDICQKLYRNVGVFGQALPRQAGPFTAAAQPFADGAVHIGIESHGESPLSSGLGAPCLRLR